MPTPARMSDVAKLARVSTMTVSRVLNENQNVLEATRQRVFAAVEQLGYRRNEVARSLRERRSRQIGILIPNLYDPFFAQCAHTVSTVAKSFGYSVSIATTDEDPEAEFSEAYHMLLRNVEGIVVIPAEVRSGSSRLIAPELEDWPMVTLDRPIPGDTRQADSLLVQNRQGAQRGTEHLIAQGRKRVAFVGLDRNLYTIRKRHEGYAAAMKAAGLPAQAVFVDGSFEVTHTEVRALLGASCPPDAFFCSNNLTTRQVLHSLNALKMAPPNPVALVGFDDFEIAELLRPGVTVVRQPTEAMARQATETLFERIGGGGKRTGRKRVVLEVELIVRGSCGANGKPG